MAYCPPSLVRLYGDGASCIACDAHPAFERLFGGRIHELDQRLSGVLCNLLRGKPQTPTETVAWLQDYKWFLNLARSRRRYALQEQRLLRQAVQAGVVPLDLIPHALRKQVSDRAPEALLRFGANEGLQRLADVVRVIDEAKKIL